jgi:hypothetical protein
MKALKIANEAALIVAKKHSKKNAHKDEAEEALEEKVSPGIHDEVGVKDAKSDAAKEEAEEKESPGIHKKVKKLEKKGK